MSAQAIRHLQWQIAGAGIAVTVFAVLASVFAMPAVVRVPLGLLLTLVLPGYALSAALSPSKLLPQVSADVALIIGLSVALTPLVVMLVDRLWTLSSVHTAIALAGAVVMCLGIAMLRLRIQTVEAI